MNDSRATSVASDRRRLVAVVLAVLISQVMIYPGQQDIIAVLGAPQGIRAGMWFLVAETGAFVAFGVVWGAASDVSGRRTTLAQGGALGGAASYLLLALAPALGIGFSGALLIRVVGGALTIGAFSLGITMLMDLSGGHGRNMGAAGIAIGLGAAVGAIVGGALADLSPLAPVYAGSVALAGSAALLWGVDDRAPGTEGSAGFGTIVSELPEVPGLIVPLVFGFVDRLTAGFFSLVGIFYFRDVFGLSASAAGITLALFFLPFALLQYHSGAASDRTGRFLPIIGGSLGYGVIVISVGVVPVYAVSAGLMVVLGVCGAFMAPATMALVTDLVPQTQRGAAMGLFNVFGSLGFLTGFLVGGVLTDIYGYLPAFIAVGSLELTLAVVALPAVRRLTTDPGPGMTPAD